jgi:ferrous iron transport protein B
MSVDQVTLALIGSPNSGKTTLFNWMTGAKFRTVNYAGSTVDCHRGATLAVYGETLSVLDTPGIYSLQPHGPDEEITLRTLTQDDNVKVVVVVVDGTQLNRQLYLVRQIQELNIPMVVAVTMMDLVEESGRQLDLRKLSEFARASVVVVDGRLGGGVKDVVRTARKVAGESVAERLRGLNWDDERIEKEIAISEAWTRAVVKKSAGDQNLVQYRKWDRFLLHPLWGILAFVAIMATLFSSIFWLAAPLMDAVDSAFGHFAQFAQVELGQNFISDFVANGLISGTGAVMVFVPQIFILFVGLSLLEDSGYLARAATIVDRPMHALGLSGRAFIPILSGFACAVPAVMASRNLRSKRERWITVFIIPFMTCSARLPVYALLLSFLFGADSAWTAGLALTALYIGGLLTGGIAAAILNRILKPSRDNHFLMELPVYRWPKLTFTIKSAFRRTVAYVRKAGPTIFVFVLLLWIGTHFPYHVEDTPTQRIQQSVVGQIGHVIEPVFEPMGLDWRAGLGMMSAFVAREVFVSSLAVIFSIVDQNQASLQEGLLDKMREATVSNGHPLFTTSSVCGLVVFFMIALQCLSTTGVTWREMNSAKYAIVQLISMNVLAYVVAILVVQGLRALGVS